MKTFKKVFAFMLAAIMVLAMTCTAFADGTTQTVDSEKGGSYTITIKNATIDETYTVYKVFDATYADGNIAYTLQNGQSIENNEYFEVIQGTDGIRVKENVSTEALTAYLKANYATDAYKVVSTPAGGATSSTVEFTNLQGGYYLVTSTLNNGAAVTLTSVGPNADIIDKNQSGPSWPSDGGKQIIDEATGNPITMSTVDGKPANSAAYGDTLHFQLKLATTNFKGEEFINNYYIKDEIGAGLSYVANTIKVYVGDAVDDDKLTETTDYTVTMGTDGKDFVISIPWINNTNLTDLAPEDVDFKYASSSSIIVRYDVTVDSSADVATALTNKANFATTTGETTTPPGPGDDGYKTETEKETNTYTFALGLQKVDGSQNPLAGAQFNVRFVENGTTYYIMATPGTGGVYTYTGITTNQADATKFETAETSGQILIKGVKEDSYVAVETDAPAGYNKLTNPTDPIAPSVTSVSTNVKKVTVWFDKDGNVVKEDSTVEKTSKEFEFADKVTFITVVNKSGAELPSTGGIGTTIFYVVGGLLVAGAGILLVTRKRMSRV